MNKKQISIGTIIKEAKRLEALPYSEKHKQISAFLSQFTDAYTHNLVDKILCEEFMFGCTRDPQITIEY